MGEDTGSRSKFNLIPFYELCLKITTYSIYRHASPNFSIAHARRMSQFQTLIRSRDSPLNTQTLIFVVFIDATTVENVPCTNKTQKILLLMLHLHFLKITAFLWIILILHPGHTILFLETVIIKFGGTEGRGPTYGARAEGREKQIPV